MKVKVVKGWKIGASTKRMVRITTEQDSTQSVRNENASECTYYYQMYTFYKRG